MGFKYEVVLVSRHANGNVDAERTRDKLNVLGAKGYKIVASIPDGFVLMKEPE